MKHRLSRGIRIIARNTQASRAAKPTNIRATDIRSTIDPHAPTAPDGAARPTQSARQAQRPEAGIKSYPTHQHKKRRTRNGAPFFFGAMLDGIGRKAEAFPSFIATPFIFVHNPPAPFNGRRSQSEIDRH
jgi:hypothetical protein